MSHEIQADKDTCERSRCSRGWASLQAWGKANRRGFREFSGKAKNGGTKQDRERYATLASQLEIEFDKYIRHNL